MQQFRELETRNGNGDEPRLGPEEGRDLGVELGAPRNWWRVKLGGHRYAFRVALHIYAISVCFLGKMEFIESTIFSRHYREYLSEDQYRWLQEELALNPEMGNVMPGTGGFRKLRWADPRRGKGRRGGLRVIYYYFSTDWQIWLMTIYDKDEMSDLSSSEKKSLRDAINAETSARDAACSKRARGK